MPAALDITGQRFGRLTALSLTGTSISSGREWRFHCDCGNEINLPVARVRNGTTRSCGCLRKETTAASRSIDLTGQRFGRLVVTDQIKERDKNRFVVWMCHCDCGTTTTATTSVLRKGSKKSCGCLHTEWARKLGASSKQENPISRTPEYRAAQRRKRRARPEQAMAERVSRLLAWALASVGAIKRSATFDMLGYKPADLKDHIEKQFIKGMTWDNRHEWQIDHITPISSATTEQDVINLNQLSNLRPMWSSENNRKKDNRHFLL